MFKKNGGETDAQAPLFISQRSVDALGVSALNRLVNMEEMTATVQQNASMHVRPANCLPSAREPAVAGGAVVDSAACAMGIVVIPMPNKISI